MASASDTPAELLSELTKYAQEIVSKYGATKLTLLALTPLILAVLSWTLSRGMPVWARLVIFFLILILIAGMGLIVLLDSQP